MSGYTRNFDSPTVTRDSTIPRFHMEAVEDPIASAAQGRPIYREEERVQIIQPGNPNSPVLLVTDEYRNRWPEHYKAFRDGQDFTTNGTPLEQWSFLRKMNVLELKAKGIHSVQQCAGLSDLMVQQLGIGGLSIRENARAYLDEAEATRIVSKALADRETDQAAISGLQSQLAEMKTLLDRLYTENMAMKNAPSAVQAYIPGQHDPLSPNAQPQQYTAPQPASSLDGLAMPKRRGRPPNSERIEQGSAA